MMAFAVYPLDLAIRWSLDGVGTFVHILILLASYIAHLRHVQKGLQKETKRDKTGGKRENFVSFCHFSGEKETKRDRFFSPFSIKSRT